MQPAAISHLLILLLGTVIGLVAGIFLPRGWQLWNAWWIAAAMTAAAVDLAALKLPAPPGAVFGRTFVMDAPAVWTQLVLLATGLLTVMLSIGVFRRDAREAEYYVLLAFALLGAMVLAGAGDLMVILLGVLLTSVGSYPLVAYRRWDPLALEALLKYYLFGALTNVGLIYGLVWLYGLSGSTLLAELPGALGPGAALALPAVLVLVGLGFKAGFVPAHYWIPDVYQGTTVPVAAFLSVVPKVAALLVVMRLAAVTEGPLPWPALVAAVAAVTMTWGNLAAFVQRDLRRLLGYSTISQTGYLLMAAVALPGSALALPGLLYYFPAYALANVGAFAVLGAGARMRIEDNRGLVRRRPVLALSMLVSLLSLVGIPPLAGFIGKYALFAAAWEAGYTWLTVLALVNSALSLYYYLRVLAPMFLGEADGDAPPRRPLETGTALACAAGSVLFAGAAYWVLGSGSAVLVAGWPV